MINTINKYRNQLFVVAVLLFILSFPIRQYVEKGGEINTVHKEVCSKLDFLEKDFKAFVRDQGLLERLNNQSFSETELRQVQARPYTIALFRDGLVHFWNDYDIVPNVLKLEEIQEGKSYRKINNAYYQCIKLPISLKDTTGNIYKDSYAFAFQLIQYDYDWENKYLKNNSSDFFNIPDYITVVENKVKEEEVDVNDLPISNKDNSSSIYLHDNNEDPNSNTGANLIVACLQFLGILIILLIIYAIAEEIAIQKSDILGFFLLTVSFVLIREIFISLQHILEIHRFPIFQGDPSNLLVHVFGSLGDMLITCSFLATIVFFFYYRVNLDTLEDTTDEEQQEQRDQTAGEFAPSSNLPFKTLFIYTGILAVVFLFSLVLLYTIEALVIHFNVQLHVRSVVMFDINAIVGFLCLFFVCISFFLVCQKFGGYIEKLDITLYERLICLGIILVPYLTYIALNGEYVHLYLVVALIIFTLFSKQFYLTNNISTSLKEIFGWSLLFCLFVGLIIIQYEQVKETENRILFAEDLNSNTDQQVIYYLKGLKDSILNDRVVKVYMNRPYLPSHELVKRIKHKYIGEHFNAYKVDILLFDRRGIAYKYVKNNVKEVNQEAYLSKLKPTQSIPGSSYVFQDVAAEKGNFVDYVVKIPLFSRYTLQNEGFVIIEVASRFNGYVNNVYPELLVPGKYREKLDYSFAVYNNDIIVQRSGDYSYENKLNPPLKSEELMNFINYNNYSHLHYRNKKNNQKTTIVSYKKNFLYKLLSLVGFLFCFAAILFLIALYLRRLVEARNQDFSIKMAYFNSLSSKINLFIIALTLACFLTIGGITVYYFSVRTERVAEESLIQKVNEIQTVISNIISDQEKGIGDSKIGFNRQKLQKEINSLSDTHSTTINIYDVNGHLVSSSLPIIFEKGYIADKMHPNAFFEMARKGQSRYLQNEKIGELSFLAVYVPINNENGTVEGFLNIPNFDQREQRRSEISNFIVALLNFYLLFFIISSGFALLIADSITRPLKLIREKLKNIKLGQVNEIIDEGKSLESDEIGELWRVYNETIIQLDESVKKLRQSERQFAWQEMARQVAHEINNPLTAMKLRLQFLQNSFKNGHPNIEEFATKTSTTLIEQIDSLSRIASHFSEIAKMPDPNKEVLDINMIIDNVVNLNDKIDGVKIFKYLPPEECHVFVDRDQILRVFNNLVKNAIQAIPDDRDGIIIVSVKKKSTFVIIGVIDNGIGISDEKKDKVFMHNFTTKNSGSGIGLALSKRMIEEAGGRIWFESTLNKTTTFFVRLPLHKGGKGQNGILQGSYQQRKKTSTLKQ